MRSSIASLALAAIAALAVTAGVAAADPLGWSHSGTAVGTAQTDAGTCCSTGWTSGNRAAPTAASTNPTGTAHPSSTAPQMHRTRMQTQTARHGSDWCNDYGRHDDHTSAWH